MKKILLVIFVFSFAWTQCDANGDGELDILDIIEEVNCILDGCWESEDECLSDDDCDIGEICMDGVCVTGDGGGYSEEDFYGTWEFGDAYMEILLTTNQDVTVLDELSPGSGAINVTGGDYELALTYMDIDEWNDGDDYEFEIDVENDNEMYEYEIYYYSSPDWEDIISQFCDDDNNDCYWSSSPYITLEGYTLTVTDTLTNDSGEEIYVSGTLTGDTMQLYAGVETVVNSDEMGGDETTFLVFNEDGTYTYTENNSNCEFLDEAGCNDDYECDWDEELQLCNDFDCSSQDNEEDCWDGPCDWIWETESCVSWDDNDSCSSSWTFENDVLTLIDECYDDYYGETETWEMAFDVEFTESGFNMSLNDSLCEMEEEPEDECFENFSGEIYGLDGDQISSVNFYVFYSMLSTESLIFFSNVLEKKSIKKTILGKSRRMVR